MSLIELEPATQPSGPKSGALQDWVRALQATAPIARNPQRILPRVIEEQAELRGEAPALLSAHESLTYGALAGRVNRYARWALDQGLGKGDVVGLMMPNRPEYMAIWLGISSVGAVVALLNTQLRGPALAHCIDIVAPKHLIVAAEWSEELRAADRLLATRVRTWSHGDCRVHDMARIDDEIERFSPDRLTTTERRAVTTADRALAIYTSGTTGPPKAANVSHHRLMQWSFWFAGLMNTGPDDRMYNCLPMYHSIGGVVATGAALVNGGSVVLRDKFSALKFWQEVRDWDCTLFQYIGELCRYLLNAPEQPCESEHRLRLCCGNGLRADVWQQFQSRFRVPRVLEFYAATEANVSLYNVEGKVGAVGRVPSFLNHRFPLALVKFDHATDEPARNSNGLCTRCGTDEIGEAIGRIGDGSAQGGGAFEGYTSAAESERKILRNVFDRGDAWYRTGDLMRRDAGGFFYFVDRIGDTFRWKGENVAASEVAAALTAFSGISEAMVYGVAIPGAEGAVGMAALVADGELDFFALSAHLARLLPSYARPLFLRVREHLEATATFKHKKNDLARSGYDPDGTADAIYFDDASQQAYVRLDRALYQRIRSGKVRL
jgi:fatty-acyl-CoA synthase